MKRDFAGRTARGIVVHVPDAGWTAVTDRSGRLPTEDEIAAINARHLVDTALQPADLLFVFGTRQDVDERVAEAARLWRDGYFAGRSSAAGARRGTSFRNALLSRRP
jgi:hypothetical protein